MADINLTATDLASVHLDGYINEDLMQEIFDVSPIDLPFTDSIGKGSSDNQKIDWARESLAAASADNARVDGSNSTGDDTSVGERLSNYHQIMSKIVKVSDRGRNVDTIGSSDELIRQLMKRGREIRRDVEAAFTSRNIAVAGDGDTVAGKLAGIGGWIGVKVKDVASTTSDRGTNGTDPLLSNDSSGGGGHPDTVAAVGVARALSETTIKKMMQAAYLQGGQPTMAMSTIDVIQILSDYLFTSSARVATLQTDTGNSGNVNNASGGGRASGGVTAQGSVNVFVTNVGVLDLVPNRFQPQSEADTAADLYLLDPTVWEARFLQGYETKELARTGLADNREITCDVSLMCENPEANSVIGDISVSDAGVA